MSSAKIACMSSGPMLGGLGGGPRIMMGPSTSSSSGSGPRRNVCKNLFGAPDRENSYAKSAMQVIQAEQIKKWNFDFEKEVPLEGRYQWFPVRTVGASSQSTSTAVPQAYGLNRMKVIGSGLQMVKKSSCKLESHNNNSSLYYEPDRVPEGSLLIVTEKEDRVRLPTPASATTTITVSHIQSQSFSSSATSEIIRNSSRIIMEEEEQSGTSSFNNPETCLNNPPQQQVRSRSESESSRESSHDESSNVQQRAQKRQKQTQLSDYWKNTKHDVGLVKKRKAESPPATTSTPPEKKATL